MSKYKMKISRLVLVYACFMVANCSTVAPATTAAGVEVTTTDAMVTIPGTDIQCPARYYSVNPNHTMCQTDVGKAIPLSDEDKRLAVQRHNEIRAAVKPLASDMLEMVWDDDLAAVAGKWARQCRPGHDEGHNDEPKLPGIVIGQNAARGYNTVVEAIDGWFSEIENFTYGVPMGNKTNGHYIQLIFANSTRVGCGMADCRGHSVYPRFQVCNYAPGVLYVHHQGETIDPETVPYLNTTTGCSSCSHHCNAAGTLCDCQGKVCFNGGVLDDETCTCTCSRVFTGPLCENKHCPADVAWKCDYYWANLHDPCSFSNVKTEDCPHKCGFC